MDWVCLNIDGAVKAHENVTGCEGLVRHHQGRWLGGFTKCIVYALRSRQSYTKVRN